MTSGRFAASRSALGWLLFPLVPAVLGDSYQGTFNLSSSNRGGPDPRDWGWFAWVVLVGPLLGYGFLAGATAGLPDEPGRLGVRGWISGRSSRVAVGPWVGFLAGLVAFFSIRLAASAVLAIHPASRDWSWPDLSRWDGTWPGWLVRHAVFFGAIGLVAYGWVPVAAAVLRRARGLGEFGRSLRRGLAVALGFVGSLFGSFWAITEAWRAHFFDPRIFPALVAASTLALMAGCAATETYGEFRRRELFQAMLMAWLIGLALAWRWWGRPRPGPPEPSPSDPRPPARRSRR